MAIAFARLEFVKRSAGKNACGKAAYNSRSRVAFHGTEWQEARTYDWSSRNPPVYHEVLLPEGVDLKFKEAEVLWNTAEQKENRRNSQSALEMVIALPDDKVVSTEDKRHLTRTFVEEHFVKKGLAAQIDIHEPETKQVYSNENQEYETADHNWHAHVLITTRRFKENGLELEDHKARELMPVVRGGRVISGEHWGKLWAQHQNSFFEQKGLSLRVDFEGIVSQRHLGPVRMRARAFSLLDEHDARVSLNALEAEDPSKVLEKITHTKNIFTAEDVDQFLHKHVNSEKVFEVKEAFWKQSEITQLLDSQTHKPLNKFTTQQIIEEEKRVMRLGDQLINQKAHAVNLKKAASFSTKLTQEQKLAFDNILSGEKLACVEGFAGTGKSNLLAALKDAYESQNYIVRGIGPDSATAQVLKEKGFSEADNVYRFLFSINKGNLKINRGEIWMLDEAGKLGTRPLLELLKCANRFGAQVILSGDSAQLPPVERGLGFKAFSQKYGAQRLENIQRQREEHQREIAKRLAKGEMGAALDAINREGSIKWRATKEDAVETLIKAWAMNKATNPNESTLIFALSNREVKALNELARLYRKEAGELKEKEFQCETSMGKIYVSVGDPIEFRRKDKELGVSNGSRGVLVKASEKSFSVRLKDGDKSRTVCFDPREYHTFQLGYATTFYRAQGKSADKAYVLHSPMMNKEMFYVGLTRHFQSVDCYISTQETKNLSDVKRQAFRRTLKESTLEYLNANDLQKQQAKLQKDQQIEVLKSSDSVLSKAKGAGISAWENIRAKTSRMVEEYKDKQPDSDFFNPKIDKQSIRGKVQEVKFEEDIKVDESKIKTDFQNIQKMAENQTPKISKPKTYDYWKKLSDEKRNSLKVYYESSDKASSLYTIVKSEEDAGEKSPHISEWQKTCVERNSHAFEVVRTFKDKEIRSVFEPKSIEILQERAARHEIQLQRKENSLIDLDAKLKENLDTLLCKLFPEGPTKRDGKGLRFGSNGSLAVAFRGKNAGSYYDFEIGEGGGPLQLIQKSLSCSKAEAINWAKDFVGGASTLQAPSHFIFKKAEKEQDWISLKPLIPHSAPSLDKISKKLASEYTETARYPYHDQNGEILFYTLRLEHKSGKKIVLPLSYGHYKDDARESSWSLKSYQADKKPLYNLQLLKEFPKAKVLIVEGEKTAEAASKLYPQEKMICLTWSGGAGAVSKSDWMPLFMRDVVIWPDNDRAGFEASDSLCKELRKIGVKNLQEVDRITLTKELPPKWDLADPLPQGKEASFIKDTILRANDKAVGLQALLSQLKLHSLQVDPSIANEVLVAIEERLRGDLEQKHCHKPWEINSEILKETMYILKNPSQIKEMLMGRYQGKETNALEFKHFYAPEHKDQTIDKSKDQELGR